MTPRPTSWSIENAGSFASVHVQLPAASSIHCESDAVVSFTNATVKGVFKGGFLGSLARWFFTKESFFTTQVSATTADGGNVMMASADPGGIVLHRFKNSNDDLLLISGSYLASDTTVQVITTPNNVESLGSTLLSKTGFFLLRASGQGTIACSAFGAVHTFHIPPGEVRAVDNGHVVAWTATMTFWVGLASRGDGLYNRTLYSITSGEGFMCFFQGPGTVHVQSHARKLNRNSHGSNKKSGCSCTVFLFTLLVILFIVIQIYILVMEQPLITFTSNTGSERSRPTTRWQRRQYGQHETSREEYYTGDL